MTQDQIWLAIERFASEHNMSCSGLARSSGLDPTTFNKSKRWLNSGNRVGHQQKVSQKY